MYVNTRKSTDASRHEEYLQVVNGDNDPNDAMSGTDLILSHWQIAQRFAWTIVRRWNINLSPGELRSIVGMALCEAASTYEPGRGTAFATHLYYHVKGNLRKEISLRIKRCENERPIPSRPDSKEDAQTISLDALIERVTPEHLTGDKQLARLCWAACKELKPVERDVILRSILKGERLKDIASDMGFSRSYISKVKAKATARIAAKVERDYRKKALSS